MPIRHPVAALFFLVESVTLSCPALAWGPEGHAIIADIAEAHLTPAAMSQVTDLLKIEGHSHLDEISSWADDVRSQRPETALWHFVDIPLDADSYDATRDCAGGACIVAKIVDFEKILADPSAAPNDRLEALKWVVHFVGDAHQPLHDEDDNDKGGNTVKLTYFGKSTNLHAVWDTGIIEHQYGLTLGPNFTFDHAKVHKDAVALDNAISAGDRRLWAPQDLTADLNASVIAWVNEGHAEARSVAYQDLPATRSGDWNTVYQTATWPVVEIQLQRGGVRLAELLNEGLK